MKKTEDIIKRKSEVLPTFKEKRNSKITFIQSPIKHRRNLSDIKIINTNSPPKRKTTLIDFSIEDADADYDYFGDDFDSLPSLQDYYNFQSQPRFSFVFLLLLKIETNKEIASNFSHKKSQEYILGPIEKSKHISMVKERRESLNEGKRKSYIFNIIVYLKNQKVKKIIDYMLFVLNH